MNAHSTNTGPKTPARRTGPPVVAGQWWKAWVLLTGFAVTGLGWLMLERHEAAPVNGAVSSSISTSAENAPAVGMAQDDQPRRVSTGIRTLPGMPAKPVFQAPITRTRRS